MRISPQKLIIPLLVSFSLTGAGVVWIYFLNKKKNEKEIRSHKADHTSKELSVPRQFVPLIIGRGGSMIQKLQESTNTKISFKEEIDVDLLERVCIITGRLENIKLAEENIKCILNNQPIIETYEAWIPQRTINKVSERGGEVLDSIQNLSNAKIILESSAPSSDPEHKKRIIIKGTAEQITTALLQIEDKVREDKDSQALTESSSLNRVPRVKTSPTTSEDKIIKNVNNSKEIFGTEANEGSLDVFVSAVESPSQFYIQVISPTNAKLDDLVSEMKDYYDSEENKELHSLRSITAGQIVAAKFPHDKKFYRAEIIDHLGDELYDVYFVDFGDRDKVDRMNIFELRTDFLSLRFQAIECSLAGVKPHDGEWSQAAIDAFSELSAIGKWEPRVAKIRGYKERVLAYGPSRREGSPIPCVELYEKRDDQLFNINRLLITLELACAESEPWSAASSTVSLSRRSQDSRARTPDDAVYAANGKPTRAIEEIDLTVTPRPAAKAASNGNNVEVIDLTTPVKEPRRNANAASRSFIESERNSPYARNGNGVARKPLPVNPFKQQKSGKTKHNAYNIIPAGFEDEMSDRSDDFDFN